LWQARTVKTGANHTVPGLQVTDHEFNLNMFFPERVKSVRSQDRVLEVGPGATPHPSSQVFLERNFAESEAFKQRGSLPAIELQKPVVYFDGGSFPFAEKEFDYVICSHVLEHVDDVPFFVGELTRVASRGYLEFPTIHYEYLYSFSHHLNLLYYQNDELLWLPKNETRLIDFSPVQKFLRSTLTAGYDEVIRSQKDSFFQGFEWFDSIRLRHVDNLSELVPPLKEVLPRGEFVKPPTGVELARELFRRSVRRIKSAAKF
jgi:methyltransferase family protein